MKRIYFTLLVLLPGVAICADPSQTNQSLEWAKVILPPIIAAVLAYIFATVREKRNSENVEKKYQEEKKIVELEQFYEKLQIYLDATKNGFRNQIRIRTNLVEQIQSRTDIRKYKREGTKNLYHWDKLFLDMYAGLTREEKEKFSFIRGITENTIYNYNKRTVELLDNFPQFYGNVIEIKKLHDHINFWLSKYHSVFEDKEEMCLVYVGVEENKPFPDEIRKVVSNRIIELRSKLKNQI